MIASATESITTLTRQSALAVIRCQVTICISLQAAAAIASSVREIVAVDTVSEKEHES